MKKNVKTYEDAQKFFDNHNTREMVLVAENTLQTLRTIEWLGACCNKKQKRGYEIDIETLANCSTMAWIIREVLKECGEFLDGLTTDEKTAAKYAIARNIIADYL